MAKYEKWLQDVISASEEVMKRLGAQDYKESVYEEALCHELRLRGIPYERQRNFELMYKGYTVGGGTVDFIINPFWATKKKADEHVMEIKAVKTLNKWHERQALVYMISLNIESGAVMTFSPDGEVVVIPQVLPKKKLIRVVHKAKNKKSTVQAHILKKALQDVHEYFGLEFMYNDGMAKCIYESALGVELRLAGIHSKASRIERALKSHLIWSWSQSPPRILVEGLQSRRMA